jgi:hypothetical protein
MKSRHISTLVMVGMALTTAAMAAKSAPTRKAPQSDLASIESRRATVDLAISLAKQETPEALPDSLPLPFNPAYGDHEILTAIAVRVTPTGTFDLGGTRWLQFSKKRLKVGDKLTVTHEGQDYTLVLSAIDATNFTLRLNREEITRPIKPGKNP